MIENVTKLAPASLKNNLSVWQIVKKKLDLWLLRVSSFDIPVS